MDDTNKNAASGGTHGSGMGQGSGSDTLSAAKLASGSTPGGTGASPGAGGLSPTPGGPSGAGAQGHAGLGSGAQSAALASHTSRPMGGTAQSGGAAGSRPGQGGGQGSSQAGGVVDQVTQAAQSATETVRDVAEQVQNRAGEVYGQAAEWARDRYEDATDWASSQYGQGSRQLSDVRRRSTQGGGQTVQRFVTENPVLVGVVGLAAGLLLGALLPRTRQEDRTLGRWSDEVREQGMRYARDMTQRGREYLDETLGDDDDAAFANPGERPRDDQRRSGPSGRYQNH